MKIMIIKRDGRKVAFNSTKISDAVKGAAREAKCDLPDSQFLLITQQALKMIEDKLDATGNNDITVEEVQDIIQKVLGRAPFKNYRGLREAYANYRRERTQVREIKSDLMKSIGLIGVETDRDNANVGNNFSSKLLRIASESNKWFNLANMPKHLAKHHENGDLYYHDLDSYNLAINCLHIPTGEILAKGFNTGYGTIRKPTKIETAAELSCILLQSTQNDMFGGQSHPDFDNDLSDYIEPTRQGLRAKLESYGLKGDVLESAVEKELKDSVRQAMQAVVYNLNTMHSRAGSQVPFSSVNIGIPKNSDAALITEMFLIEYEKGLGKGEQPIFPNIIFRVKKGVNAKKDDPYNYLYKLACRVAAKRMNPTFMNLDADFNKEYYDKGYLPATMGCRTYIMSNINGEPGVKGRGNIAPVTINLPRLALIANHDEDMFFELLDEKLDAARESIMDRYSVLKKLKVKDLPFVAGEGLMKGSEGLGPQDSIEPILKQGTFGIGFIGLAETLVALTGKHHGEDKLSRELGEKIVKHIRKYTDTLTRRTKLNWATYATPAEGLSGKFIVQDKKVFGEIPGVTDKDYYTNSFHVPVGFEIGFQEKIQIEAPYHKLCNSGHISYVEVDGYPSEEDIADILEYAYENTNINYIGINFHIKYCKECGTYLDNNECKCKSCGSTDIQGISRVTGYLSLDERFGSGKVAERCDRLTHDGSCVINYDC